MAASTGTPLARRVDKVREKRDTAIIVSNGPKVGNPKIQVSHLILPFGLFCQRLNK